MPTHLREIRPIRRDVAPELGIALYFCAEDLTDPAAYEAAVRDQLKKRRPGETWPAGEDLEQVIARLCAEARPALGAAVPPPRDVSPPRDDASPPWSPRPSPLAHELEEVPLDRVALDGAASAGRRARANELDELDPAPHVSTRQRGAPTAPRRVRAILSGLSSPFGYPSGVVADGWAVPDKHRPDLWRIERVQFHRAEDLSPVTEPALLTKDLERIEQALRADIREQLDALIAAPSHARFVRLYCLRTGLELAKVIP